MGKQKRSSGHWADLIWEMKNMDRNVAKKRQKYIQEKETKLHSSDKLDAEEVKYDYI